MCRSPPITRVQPLGNFVPTVAVILTVLPLARQIIAHFPTIYWAKLQEDV